MKAVLIFKLPEEQHEYDLVNQAQKLNSILYDIKQEIRNKIKYENCTEEIKEEFIKLRQFIADAEIDEGIVDNE